MEEKDEQLVEEKEVSSKKKFKEKLQKKDDEIEALKAEVNHWKNEYYRAYADTQNLRKSLEKDHHEAIRYRAEGFIENLLPILDSFHMALANSPTNPEIKNYVTGFSFVYRNLVSVLEEEGVREIAPKENDIFDARIMEAVETIESDEEENLVKKVYVNGYLLHDHLIRPARVLVTKKKENKESTPVEE
ncbi:MAG: nucleotide exchange factor GrpE [Bacilli bacterium]|nr:nucleotide exchange factor GrpE [Bacilli bacterium]